MIQSRVESKIFAKTSCIAACALLLMGSAHAQDVAAETVASETTSVAATPAQKVVTAHEKLPVGKVLVYVSGGEMVVVRADGTAQVLGEGLQPSLSPDGTHVAFVREKPIMVDSFTRYPGDIWIWRIGDEAPVQITDTEQNETDPTWHPSGKLIAFSSKGVAHAGNANGLIEVIKPDGTQRRALTANEGSKKPSYSADGKWIVFLKTGGVSVMDANGRKRRRISNSMSDDRPSFSPDGKWVLFSSGSDEDVETRIGGRDGEIVRSYDRIVIARADIPLPQFEVTHLYSNSRDYDMPCWSPDGQWVAYQREEVLDSDEWGESRTGYSIYISRRDGSEGRQLTMQTQKSETHPTWR